MLIQIAYHTLFITANDINNKIFLLSAKTHINNKDNHDITSQIFVILYVQYFIAILLKKSCNQKAGIAIIQSNTYHHQFHKLSKNAIKKVTAKVSQNQNVAPTAKLQYTNIELFLLKSTLYIFINSFFVCSLSNLKLSQDCLFTGFKNRYLDEDITFFNSILLTDVTILFFILLPKFFHNSVILSLLAKTLNL